MAAVCGTFCRDVNTGFWWRNPTERCQWEYNIKMDLKEIGCGGTDWIVPAWDKGKWKVLVDVVTNLQASGFMECG
jgi:hypothetical protein